MIRVTVWACSPSWESWIADQIAAQEAEHFEDEIDRDLQREAELAREFAAGEIGDWPWYADLPVEVFELAEPIP